jgi:hypothetical protein
VIGEDLHGETAGGNSQVFRARGAVWLECDVQPIFWIEAHDIDGPL